MTISAMKHLVFLVLLAPFIIARTSLDEPSKLSEHLVEGEATLSDVLWDLTSGYHYEALNSNLINGMKNKCLDPSQFGAFSVDDAAYLYYGSESLSISAKNADSEDDQVFLGAEGVKWYGYWEGMSKAAHVENIQGIAMGEAITAYVNHIKDVADNDDSGYYTMIALTPCARLWPWLGEQIGSGTNDFGVYTKWVEDNLNPSSKGYGKYETRFNEAYARGEIDGEKALEIYTLSMQGEVAFFNSVDSCTSTETVQQKQHSEL